VSSEFNAEKHSLHRFKEQTEHDPLVREAKTQTREPLAFQTPDLRSDVDRETEFFARETSRVFPLNHDNPTEEGYADWATANAILRRLYEDSAKTGSQVKLLP
jgi:hypothetical protein